VEQQTHLRLPAQLGFGLGWVAEELLHLCGTIELRVNLHPEHKKIYQIFMEKCFSGPDPGFLLNADTDPHRWKATGGLRNIQPSYRKFDGYPQHKTYVQTTPLPEVLNTTHRVSQVSKNPDSQ
jgi:hypothetical protein